ncbi:MAG: hypothetical protein AB7Q16_17095 [Vicinamibacterales bacterium]
MSSPSRERATAEQLRRRFRSHLVRNAGIAGVGIAASLAAGMAGYHWLGPMPWVDAFLNASMLLGGMGPVSPLANDRVKLFAGAYAIYCGVVFIAAVGLALAPIATHVLHRFHMDRD